MSEPNKSRNQPHDVIYGQNCRSPDDAISKVSRMIHLARIGLAATESNLAIDLNKAGYSGLFETIARLGYDVIFEIPEGETGARQPSKK